MSDAFEKYSQSIYAMGSDHKLTFTECEDVNLATEIATTIDFYQSTIEDEISIGGMIRRLRRSKLNFDIKPFNKKYRSVNKNRKTKTQHDPEICRIIYLMFALEYELIPELLNKLNPDQKEEEKRKYFDVINFLNKPSMENVDYSFLGWETYNGNITRLIKNLLEKGLHKQTIAYIQDTLDHVADIWNARIAYAHRATDIDIESYFELSILALNSILDKPHKITEDNTSQLSPIAALYLKVSQFERLGELKDILLINRQQLDVKYDVPQEYIEDMNIWKSAEIRIDTIEGIIKTNNDTTAKYVYPKTKPTPDERRRMVDNAWKVPILLECCARARLDPNAGDKVPMLQIFSCLQAILIDEKSDFKYFFPLYQIYMKHKPTDHLKKNKHIVDAVKLYWARRIDDRWYANLGEYELRCKIREYDNRLYKILTRIYSCPNIAGIKSANQYYSLYFVE